MLRIWNRNRGVVFSFCRTPSKSEKPETLNEIWKILNNHKIYSIILKKIHVRISA